jgi:hypothetical protein
MSPTESYKLEHQMNPTPYADVNSVLHDFQTRIQAILGNRFRAMYVYGSLALGGFDPHNSDIDFIVVTDTELPDATLDALRVMHIQFTESDSPWAEKVEAAYIPQEALNHSEPTDTRYPQVEKGRPLFKEPLEIGWAFQRHTLREYGIVVSGAAPSALINPVNPDDMRWSAVAITGGWLDQARHDPEWLDWVGHREGQAFVVLTLCRFLYLLDSGTITSKPAAAAWGQKALPVRWRPLIERSLARQHDQAPTPESDVIDTLYLIQYTFDRLQS